jgi:hypothetical protein
MNTSQTYGLSRPDELWEFAGPRTSYNHRDMTFRALANLEAVFRSELQDPQAVERLDDLKLAEGRIPNRQALQVEGLAVSQVLICISPCAAPP